MSELTFEQMLDESFKTIHNGEVVDGTVIDVKPDEIILNIGYKADGIITRSEYTNDNSVDLTTVVSVGDPMTVKDVYKRQTLNSVGQHKSKSGGEKHLYNPRTIHMLQQSTRRGDYEMFKQYTQMVDEESKGITLRGQMDFNYPKKGVPLSEVESVDSIVTRFKTGAMSYGSISKEAHETLALAMNALHGK